MIYKPALVNRITEVLALESVKQQPYLTCCRHEPKLTEGTQIINTCAGCDRRYRELYPGIATISLWEVLASSETFPFPDYQWTEMSIHDACPTRSEKRVHSAVRQLLCRMNITVVEPKFTMSEAICCGDSFYGTTPLDKVKEKMRQRAQQMPCDDVVVYCVSCVNAMHIGGKNPRHLVDLLFGEKTVAKTFEPDQWHFELQKFIDESVK
jgi:Fe-S oxidoreductase